MMQQKMPWDEDWSQPQAPAPFGGSYTITTPRDPRQVAREDRADARAIQADARADHAAARADAAADRAAKNDAVRLDFERRRLALAEQAEAGKAPGKQDLAAVRAEALEKIRLARTLQQRSRDGWFTTGIGAKTTGYFSGTPAYDVAQDTSTLKNAGALTRIMEMAKQNGGKNPLTPLSNSDFEALASSLSNIDPGQSDEQYQRNVQTVIDLYTRAYRGAGGTDLEGELDPTKKRRDKPVVGMAYNPPSPTIAGGATKQDRDPDRERALDGLIRSGADMATINARSRAMGGMDIDPAKVREWQSFYSKHPDYRGSSVDTSVAVPTTAWNQFTASPIGTGIYAAVDTGLAGLSDEFASLAGGGDLADLNARKQAAFAANPKLALTGQVVGGLAAMTGLGALGRSTGVASRFANPALVGDIAFGAASGAGQSNDNRLLGSALGGVGSLAGNVAGNAAANVVGKVARTQPGMMFQKRARGIFGAPMLSDARPLNSVDRTAFSAIDRAGVDNVTGQLTEAQRLGVPMSLADTNPNLRELAGAAVRRSPTASSFAEDVLLPRGRGQYDRFTSSVNTNLGPTANVPQLSADLMTQARTAASDLYNRAYSAPVPSTPELDAVLNTPFGRQALGRARTIAGNERRSPDELGFALDVQGNVVLNPRPNDAIARHLDARAELDAAQDAYRASSTANNGVSRDAARQRVMTAREALRRTEQALAAAPDPSSAASVPAYTTQTLDYVKRGMDDVLEEQRNPITGRLVLDEAGRAQNQVRSQLLSEVDRLNPDFAAARSAYAGPMESRNALSRGADAYRLHPDELGMQVGTQSSEQLGQMQLGYRGAMVDHAGKIRDSGNPWETTLGSPVARLRLETMYPGNPGVTNMLRQRELEGQLAQTTTGVLGNSKTAQRSIADDAFAAGNPIIEGGLHAGAAFATGGASIPGTAARVAGAGLKNWMARGQNRMSEARADALVPTLLNTDPSASLDQVMRYVAQQREWQALVDATTPRRALGMFGRGFGSQAAVVPLNR